MAEVKRRNRLPPDVQQLFAQAVNVEKAPPRKHHLVPAFYLRRWAKDGQIRVTDTSLGRDYKRAPEKAARQTDFYRLEAEDRGLWQDVPPLLFEVLLGRVEEWGKAAIDQLGAESDGLDIDTTVQFAWYLALQFTRGMGFREELRSMANEMFKTRFGGITDEGIRRQLRRAGTEPTPDAVKASRTFLDELNSGELRVRPQDATTIGMAGQAAAIIGEHFLSRTWVVFRTPPVLITCDEPVVLVGGPGTPRQERAGVATAAVVVFPLDASHVLALFRDDIARALGGTAPPGVIAIGELDLVDAAELCLEVGMNCHRWIFESPSKRVGPRLDIPQAPEPFSLEEVAVHAADPHRKLLRSFKKTRWQGHYAAKDWPVRAWWH